MTVFLTLATWLLVGATIFAADAPKYLFFNIAPGAGHSYTEEAVRNAFDEVPVTLHVVDNPRLRVGVSFVFSTLETPTEQIAQRIRTALECSEKTSTPVLIALDGQNWWENRPDLWNWWDTNKPGYNRSNVFNVEWTGWSPTNAIKISWRNWGVVHRVAPAQNIGSPVVLDLQLRALRELVPMIVEWHRKLPADRKWLLGGLKVGWEASIGYNAYYYADGNRYIERWPNEASHDPRTVLNWNKGMSGGAVQLGYAALTTARLKGEGKITRDDLALVTALYLEKLCRAASEAGLPRELVFTHQGGTYKPWDRHMPFRAAMNRWAIPGWSFYGLDPNDAGPLGKELDSAKQNSWAACEWWWGGSNSSDWEDHFTRTLRFLDCRFIDVYNWTRAFERDLGGQSAVRRLVARW
jgi:hypothetical protein